MPSFTDTFWTKVNRLKDAPAGEKRDLLGEFFEQYRVPLLAYLRARGYRENADDLLNGYFAYCLEKTVLEKADRQKAKFRSFLLLTLKRYVWHQRPRSFEELDETTEQTLAAPEPGPDQEFEHAWVRSIVASTDRAVRRELVSGGRGVYYDILRALLLAPIIEGAATPSYRELAARFGMTEKQVGNSLVTAKRVFQRLLREEIATYARSADEVEEEIRDLFTVFRD